MKLDQIESNQMHCNKCEYENSKFRDSHHKDIITGDLSNVEHDLLRELMQEGLILKNRPSFCLATENFKGAQQGF